MLARSAGLNRASTWLISSMKVRQQAAPGPRVARVVPGRQPPFGEVDRHPGRAGREGLPDVLLALVDKVGFELLAAVSGDFLVQRVQQREHRRGDDCLLHRPARHRKRLRQRLGGVGAVPERAADQLRQLPVVPVGEDGEVLTAAGQVLGQPGPGERVRQRVGGETGPALLAVGNDRRPGRLLPLDRVPDGCVLLGLELLARQRPGVVGGVGVLKFARPRQRSHRLDGDSGTRPRIVSSHVRTRPFRWRGLAHDAGTDCGPGRISDRIRRRCRAILGETSLSRSGLRPHPSLGPGPGQDRQMAAGIAPR